MEVRDNKIIIEINVNERPKRATKKQQPKKQKETGREVKDLIDQGTQIASGLPFVGPTIGKFSSISGGVQNLGTAFLTGGATAALTTAGIVVAALAFAHDTAKEYVQNRRQSEELQRRAGYRRKQ